MWPLHRSKRAPVLLLAAWSFAVIAHAQTTGPLIFNVSTRALPGDVIGIQGANLGADPQVVLEAPDGRLSDPLVRLNSWDGMWVAARIPEGAPLPYNVRVRTSDGISKAQSLTAAQPHHLDALELSPGGWARLFGRHLQRDGMAPRLTINGQLATIDAASSNAEQLRFVVPNHLTGTHAVTLEIDNGLGPVRLQRDVSLAPAGEDIWNTGISWTQGFSKLASLKPATTVGCDASSDNTPTIQSALDRLQAAGGGVLRLPAGTCPINGTLQLRSNTVLQGAGMAQTVLRYTHDYPIFGRQLDRIAVRDLTLENGAGAIESPLIQNSTHVVLQNVRFALGGGIHMYLTGNRNVALLGCEIVQPANARGNGTVILNDSAGVSMIGNRLQFAQGAPSMARVHDAYVADNTFLRVASEAPFPRSVVHSLAIDFAHHIAIVGNHFKLAEGVVKDKMRNDGEGILTEGGGGNRTEWTGTVQAASADTFSDPAFRLNPQIATAKPLPENFGVAIVGGTGAGQHRRVTQVMGTTVQVTPPWDLVPDASSRYATLMWGLEKALIQRNTFEDIPRGIWLYQTGVRDVAILDNDIHNGGGIYLRAAQNLTDHLFTPMFNIQIIGNRIVNDNGQWAAYISTQFVRMDVTDFGVATTGIEIRDNVVQTQLPNLHMPQEEAGAFEGFTVRMHREGASQNLYPGQTRLLGTVLQGNQCGNCESVLRIREGARGTVLDNNR